MDFLNFAMENYESESKVRRLMAKTALMAEKAKADLYERYLMKKPMDLPENPLRDKLMLQRILEQAEQYEKKQKLSEETK